MPEPKPNVEFLLNNLEEEQARKLQQPLSLNASHLSLDQESSFAITGRMALTATFEHSNGEYYLLERSRTKNAPFGKRPLTL